MSSDLAVGIRIPDPLTYRFLEELVTQPQSWFPSDRQPAVILVSAETFREMVDKFQTPRRMVQIAPGVLSWLAGPCGHCGRGVIDRNPLFIRSDAARAGYLILTSWPSDWKVV